VVPAIIELHATPLLPDRHIPIRRPHATANGRRPNQCPAMVHLSCDANRCELGTPKSVRQHDEDRLSWHDSGAIVSMKIYVVTPYYGESAEWLRQAHASVKAQAVPARHILVCDGSAPAQIPDFQGTHIILQRNYRDYGNTPRLIGCYDAIAQDADAIAFLDADNWYYPGHLQSLIELALAEKLDAVSSTRMLHRLDGSPMIKCRTVDGRNYIDTNCLMVLQPAFRYLIAWVLQGQDTAAETDQYLWRLMRSSGARLGFVDRPTVAYRTRHRAHYEQAREPAPPEAIRRTDLHGDRYQ
jgi:hypothetical protein